MARPVPGSAATSRRSRPGRFRHWRRTRPFWGAFLVILGGAEILVSVRAPLPVILHIGLQGLAGYAVPLLLVTCGVLLLATPAQRPFYAVVSIILALASWLTSNLGGFVVGMLLALVGGCLALAWTPGRRTPTRAADGSTAATGTAGTDADAVATGTAATDVAAPGIAVGPRTEAARDAEGAR